VNFEDFKGFSIKFAKTSESLEKYLKQNSIKRLEIFRPKKEKTSSGKIFETKSKNCCPSDDLQQKKSFFSRKKGYSSAIEAKPFSFL